MPTYGTDVEIFCASEKGELASPARLLPTPKTVEPICAAGGWNRDGIAIEINPEPSSSPYAVQERILTLRGMIEPVLRQIGLMLLRPVRVDLREMPEDVRYELPEDCWELGCEPDYNAYTGLQNVVKVDPHTYPYRTAGGHITMGTPLARFEDACELVKLFDAYAGLYSVVHMEGPDAAARRELYGKAGCFRFHKKDGLVEYRTPSADWFWTPNGYTALCVEMEKAWRAYCLGLRLVNKDITRLIQHTINVCDKATAEDLLYGNEVCTAE